jgi:hypothetical protein
MVWKMQKSREIKLVTLKANLEAREKFLLAKGLPKERTCYDPIVRHLIAESRKIKRAIAAHNNAQESAAVRAEKVAKLKESKPAKPGKEPKAPKEPKAAKSPEAGAPPAAATGGTPDAS